MGTEVSDSARFAMRAAQLRAEAASRIWDFDRRSPRPDGHCHFELYRGAMPLGSARNAVAFNRAVTSAALAEVLKSEDPVEVAFLGARVVEETFQVIYGNPGSRDAIKNLSVAKHFGTFFTSRKIAAQMVAEITPRNNAKTLLDPCVGSGALLCASLLGDDRGRYKEYLGVELDCQLASWGRKIVQRVANLTGYRGKIHVETGDGLSYLLSNRAQKEASTTDIIINPPYGRLRITSDLASNEETRLIKGERSLKEIQFSIAKRAGKLRSLKIFSGERGILESSRLFFRACAQWASGGSTVSIISPDAWLSAADAATLREILIERRLIRKVLLISESEGDFRTVNQSTAITVLRKSTCSHYELSRLNGVASPIAKIDYMDADRTKTNAVPRLVGGQQMLHQRLSQSATFSSQSWLINARGELDQTNQKDLFRVRKTKIPLVRGEHVTRFLLSHYSDAKKPSFVEVRGHQRYISGKPKERHFHLPRIVGRQCSYARQERRLIFCQIDARNAVGNSCNYLVVDAGSPDKERRLRALVLGLLNSALLDWWFRASNSNNHVANYEIDALPYPSESPWLDLISSLVEKIVEGCTKQNKQGYLLDLLEAVVFLAYGVTDEQEIGAVLSEAPALNRERITNYVRQLSRGVKLEVPCRGERFFNNKLPTLSALDLEMISHVPEGGNWQSIPTHVPSQRLNQIRQMTAERGVVRTTYYGRLRRDQPSYTVNTYFNRPGNGTHIHPLENRTITSREAARLQSFPDRYIFLGGEGAVRNQIGNAVPPLLAKAVGERLLAGRSGATCVDVFCGAGGLSLGLESAGWNVVAAIDNDTAAVDTYSFNRPSRVEGGMQNGHTSAVYQRDLQRSVEFRDCVERIREDLQGGQLDLLAGGPPCQGFSHAGFRLQNDDRNDLAAIFLNFTKELMPRIFLLENVEGLLTFKGGAVLREIIKTLGSLGYRVQDPVWHLSAEEFGVPQMRRRVFVVATIDPDLCLSPPRPTFRRCAGRRREVIPPADAIPLKDYWTVADALGDLSLPAKDSELMSWFES